MTRKTFLSTAAAPFVPAPQGGRRPKNVLFLLSDQHAPRTLGIEGDPLARTPHLDALARTSVRFRNTYCTNPVCTPSRASILTGLYTHHHRTLNNRTPWPFEIRTMAHHFSRAGYMSSLVGKMHFVDAQTHGFDYRLDFNDWYQYLGPKTKLFADELGRPNSGSGLPQIDDLWLEHGDPWEGAREKDGRLGSVHVGRPSLIPERDHFENFVSRESVRFLKNYGKQTPFFLIASYLKPHDPFMPGSRFAAMYPSEKMPLPRTWNKADSTRVPKEVRERMVIDRPTPELKDLDNVRLRRAMYYGNVAHLDDAIGQVTAALRELGLEKDTIVVYSSDHGEMNGEHNLWNKFVFYDPSAGVPMFIRAPGVTTENTVCDTPVSQVSLLATLCDLCGIAVPSGLDGDSLVPLLREPARKEAGPVYSQFALGTPNAKAMIRSGDWKYSHYRNDTPELYNLRDDPDELRNLAESPEHRARAEDLKARLLAWHRPA